MIKVTRQLDTRVTIRTTGASHVKSKTYFVVLLLMMIIVYAIYYGGTLC